MAETINWTACDVELGDLKPWDRNPKSISKNHARRLIEYWQRIGQFQTIAIGPGGEVYDGHQRLSCLLSVYGASYVVKCLRASRPLTDEERQELVIAAHVGTTGQFDWDALSGWDAGQLQEWGMDAETLASWNSDANALREMIEAEKQEQRENNTETDEETDEQEGQPLDYIFPSYDKWGVPMLDVNLQATGLPAPFMAWGTVKRTQHMPGTWHFYIDDYRFENIWRNPEQVFNTRCAACVEPNFSVYTDMPAAVALWGIYRKRWISRYWQALGLFIFVDLNIAHKHEDLIFLGVPEGWTAYATRAYSDRLDETEHEYSLAQSHAGDKPIMFVVYGGGKKAQELSINKGWIWYPDQQSKMCEVKHG